MLHYSTAFFTLASLGISPHTHGFASLNRALYKTLEFRASMPARDAVKRVVKELCPRDIELAMLLIRRYAKKPRFIAVFGHDTPTLDVFLARLAGIIAV